MTGLVFLHGWGYGPQTWDSLVAAFSPAPVIVLDAGYFGPPRLLLSGDLPDGLPGNLPEKSAHTPAINCPHNLPANAAGNMSIILSTGRAETLKNILPKNPGGWLGVGHTLGFARLLALDLPWRGLVGIGGFLRFCQKPGKSGGTPTDLLDAMLARLDTTPLDVLARFHKRCGHRIDRLPALPADGLERLRTDLAHLRDLDLSRPTRPVPTLLVHALDDRIVPPDLAREAHVRLSEAAPGSRLELLASGGHALPMTRPQDCQRLIRDFLHELG